MNHLTRNSPPPEPRRRRTEDTGRAAFRMAAGRIVRRAARIPAKAYAATTAYLSETLDWFNLWQQNADEALDENFQPVTTDHLYPHL